MTDIHASTVEEIVRASVADHARLLDIGEHVQHRLGHIDLEVTRCMASLLGMNPVEVEDAPSFCAFVTCTQCGARFTMVHRLPYDRSNTAMAGSGLCAQCARDYRDPAGSRFHAKTIAFPFCRPRLRHGIDEIALALRRGQVLAIEGLGGFNLFCNAGSEAAVPRLRGRKGRPDKPLAITVANLAAIDALATHPAAESALLAHPACPIVVLHGGALLASSGAPGMNRIGVMLASTPIHHVLFLALGAHAQHATGSGRPPISALVATSANTGGESTIHRRRRGAASLVRHRGSRGHPRSSHPRSRRRLRHGRRPRRPGLHPSRPRLRAGAPSILAWTDRA
jgi:tRNA A37 threonylcarbamoyladenosine synthetase subunit TsaC/SUA5/YrdC